MSIYDVFSGGNRPFDKEEWAAAKQAQRKEAYELIDNTCSEMVASGDSFRQYLDVQKANPQAVVLLRLGDFYEMFLTVP